jgi:hypothetical protein
MDEIDDKNESDSCQDPVLPESNQVMVRENDSSTAELIGNSCIPAGEKEIAISREIGGHCEGIASLLLAALLTCWMCTAFRVE